MMYDFDAVIDRRNTDSYKYDALDRVFGTTDLLPMWVADMDFQSPPEVLAAARACTEKGVFAYTYRSEEANEAFIRWVDRRHGWNIQPEWMLASPGVVTALAIGVRTLTQPGDKVLVFTPVYHPFLSIPREQGRQLICSPLRLTGNRYEIDWENLENHLKQGIKLMIICNPHNPVGRQWSRQELLQLGMLCLQYGVTILSDEIHSDLPLFGHRHTVMASLSPEIADITITAMAPSKTFNVAGTMNSVVVISSPALRALFEKELTTLHINGGNILGHVTFKAAYQYGEPWLEALIRYLENNVRYTGEFLRRELPEISLIPPECSFLLWLDFRGTGLSHKTIGERLLYQAKLGLNNGTDFGTEGEGFYRMNIGCPLSTLQEGLLRLKNF